MALADYRLCDICERKAFYDANLNYDFDNLDECGNPKLDYVGDWAVICCNCAQTHEVHIVTKEDAATPAQATAAPLTPHGSDIEQMLDADEEATAAPADPDGDFAKGMLMTLAARGASPAALGLAAQLFGVGPCQACGFRKLHCRCVVPTAAPTDLSAAILALPKPDTHCWDEDTKTDVWSYSVDLVKQIVASQPSAVPQAAAVVATQKGGAHVGVLGASPQWTRMADHKVVQALKDMPEGTLLYDSAAPQAASELAEKAALWDFFNARLLSRSGIELRNKKDCQDAVDQWAQAHEVEQNYKTKIREAKAIALRGVTIHMAAVPQVAVAYWDKATGAFYLPGEAIADRIKASHPITPLYAVAVPQEGSKLHPCRSPYCECEPNKCSSTGFFDARHRPL